VRYLNLSEALELHRRIIGQSGGALGVLNLGSLESALAQPRMTFGEFRRIFCHQQLWLLPTDRIPIYGLKIS